MFCLRRDKQVHFVHTAGDTWTSLLGDDHILLCRRRHTCVPAFTQYATRSALHMSTTRQLLGRATVAIGSLFAGGAIVHNLYAPDLVRRVDLCSKFMTD